MDISQIQLQISPKYLVNIVEIFLLNIVLLP